MGFGQYWLMQEDLPPLFRNPFVLTGYRPVNRPWAFYFNSLFGLHNETVNIWTHLLGSVFIAHTLVQFRADFRHAGPSAGPLVGLVLLYGCFAVALQLVSAGAHLLHSRSPRFHLFAYSLDYVATATYCFGYCMISYCFYAHSDYFSLVRPLVVPACGLAAFLVSALMSFFLIAWHRQSSFGFRLFIMLPLISIFLFGFSLFLHRLWLLFVGGERVLLMPHHIVHGFCHAMGFPFFALHLPERWWPGRFDIFGSGHQLFHCVMTTGFYFAIRGARFDLEQGRHLACSQPDQQLSLPVLWLTQAVIIASSLVTIFFLERRHQAKIQ